MKRLIVGDQREDLLSTLEVILKHWGHRVLASPHPEDIAQALRDTPPDVLILNADWVRNPPGALAEALAAWSALGKPPVIALCEPDDREVPPSATALQIPVDLFKLFQLVQYYLQSHPRRNLRLTVSIPGMVCKDESSHLAEVISVSTRGLFVRTGTRMERGDQFRVVIPLMGMKQELDLEGRVLYRMEPTPENNYRQGVGIEFMSLSGDQEKALEDFLEKRLLDELVESQRGGDLDPRQIRLHSRETVHLVKTS